MAATVAKTGRHLPAKDRVVGGGVAQCHHRRLGLLHACGHLLQLRRLQLRQGLVLAPVARAGLSADCVGCGAPDPANAAHRPPRSGRAPQLAQPSSTLLHTPRGLLQLRRAVHHPPWRTAIPSHLLFHDGVTCLMSFFASPTLTALTLSPKASRVPRSLPGTKIRERTVPIGNSLPRQFPRNSDLQFSRSVTAWRKSSGKASMAAFTAAAISCAASTVSGVSSAALRSLRGRKAVLDPQKCVTRSRHRRVRGAFLPGISWPYPPQYNTAKCRTGALATKLVQGAVGAQKRLLGNVLHQVLVTHHTRDQTLEYAAGT